MCFSDIVFHPSHNFPNYSHKTVIESDSNTVEITTITSNRNITNANVVSHLFKERNGKL